MQLSRGPHNGSDEFRREEGGDRRFFYVDWPLRWDKPAESREMNVLATRRWNNHWVFWKGCEPIINLLKVIADCEKSVCGPHRELHT